MATTEAENIPETIPITKGVGESISLASGKSDGTVGETPPGDLKKIQEMINLLPETPQYLAETENVQAANNVGADTMNSAIKDNVETPVGERFLESPSAAEVSSEETCRVEKHCQANEVPFQADEIIKDEKQMQSDKKVEVSEEGEGGASDVMEETEEKVEKNGMSHDIVNLAATSLKMAKIEESNLKAGGEESSKEETVIDQHVEVVANQHVPVEDKSAEKETIDVQKNEKDGANTDLECNEQVHNVIEATSDQTKEASVHIPDQTVISLNKDVETVAEPCNKEESATSGKLTGDELGETSSREEESKEAKKSIDLVDREHGTEATKPSENASNEKDAKEDAMYDTAGDTFILETDVRQDIQSVEEAASNVGEGEKEVIYQPSFTLATDVSSVEAEPEASEKLKESSSISCKDKIEPEKSIDLASEEWGPEATKPSESVGNEKDEKEDTMYDTAGDTFILETAAHPDIQCVEEATPTIKESEKEEVDQPSVTRATDVSSVCEAEPEAGEKLEESSSISCKEKSEDKIEPSDKMRDIIPVDDEMNRKNNIDASFATRIEETCSHKVDNPEQFKVFPEILSDNIIKESPNEIKEQMGMIEKTEENDRASTEKDKDHENSEFVKYEDTLSVFKVSTGENRDEGRSTIMLTKDNIDDTEITDALEDSRSGISSHEERPEKLQQNEPKKEVEGSSRVVADDNDTGASTENTEAITCVKEDAPIESHAKSIEEKIRDALENNQTDMSNHEERPANAKQNEPQKEKLDESSIVVAEDLNVDALTGHARTITCVEEEAPIRIHEESFEENMMENLPIHTDALSENETIDKNVTQVVMNEKIECAEAEVPNNNGNDLHVAHQFVEEALQNEGKILDEVSSLEPEGKIQEAHEASTEEEKHLEDAPEACQSANSTILENTSMGGAVTTELIPKTAEIDMNKLQEACRLDSEEKSVIEDNGENTGKEMQKKEEACVTMKHEKLEKGAGDDAEASIEINNVVLPRDETVQKNIQVESPLEETAAMGGEDKSHKAEDIDKENNLTNEEAHDGTRIIGTGVAVNEQVINCDITDISTELIEQETVESSQENINKAEKSEESNKEQIMEESVSRDLLPVSVEQDSVKSLKDEQTKAETTGEIFENCKTISVAGSIADEPSKTTEIPKETLDNSLVKQGEGLQREGKNLTPTEASPEENRNGYTSPVMVAEENVNDSELVAAEDNSEKEPSKSKEDLEERLSPMNQLSSNANKNHCLVEEGSSENLKEVRRKEENEKETEDIKDEKIVTEEDLGIDAETSDASKKDLSETDEIVVEEEIRKEEYEELNEDSKNTGKGEGMEKHKITEECGTTNIFPEPTGEKTLQSVEEDGKEKETPTIEVCVEPETTNAADTEKQILEEENTVDQSRELEAEKIEQKEDDTTVEMPKEGNVIYISPESIEQEKVESPKGNKNNTEKSEEENSRELIIEDSKIRGLVSESVEQGPVKNLKDDEEKEDISTGEISENSKTAGVAESISDETSKTNECPKEVHDASLVKQEENFLCEGKNLTPTEASPEENRNEKTAPLMVAEENSNDSELVDSKNNSEKEPSKSKEDLKERLSPINLKEKLERSSSEVTDETEAFSSNANKNPCLVEEGASKNLEEASQKEENEKEAEDINDIKDNKIATKEALEIAAQTPDTILEPQSEMDKMEVEDERKKEKSEEFYEDSKNAGKGEDQKQTPTEASTEENRNEDISPAVVAEESSNDSELVDSKDNSEKEPSKSKDLEERLSPINLKEKLEQSSSEMTDETEVFSSNANKKPCLVEEGASKNLEEGPQKEENEKEREDSNDIKDNKIATKEALEIAAQTPDTILEPQSEMDKMEVEDERKKEESEELYEDSKNAGKGEGQNQTPTEVSTEENRNEDISLAVVAEENSNDSELVDSKDNSEKKPSEEDLEHISPKIESGAVMTDETEALSSNVDKNPCLVKEGASENFEEVHQKAENKKETEDIKDDKIAMVEDLGIGAETSDARKSTENTVLEPKSETDKIVVEEEIKTEESEEMIEDSKNAGKVEDMQKHDMAEECGSTDIFHEPTGEKSLQSAEEDEKEEEAHTTEACVEQETTSAGEDTEKQILEDNTVDQSTELEVEKIEQSATEDDTIVKTPKQANVTYISSESIEQEIDESFHEHKNKGEKSEEESNKEQIMGENASRGLIPESVEQDPTHSLKDNQTKAESTEEILENSKTAEVAESIADETSKTIESPKEVLDTSLVKQGENLLCEGQNPTPTEASLEETRNENTHPLMVAEDNSNDSELVDAKDNIGNEPSKSKEDLEERLSVINQLSSNANKNPCLVEEGASENLEEAPQKEDNGKETEDINDTKDNKIANDEALETADESHETSDTRKSTESTVLEPPSEMDKMAVEVDKKKEEYEEFYEDSKSSGKGEDTEKHSIIEECGTVNLPEPIGEKTLQSLEEDVKEVPVEPAATSFLEDDEKQISAEEKTVEKSRELEVEKIEPNAKEDDTVEKISSQEGCEISQTVKEDDDAGKQNAEEVSAAVNNFEVLVRGTDKEDSFEKDNEEKEHEKEAFEIAASSTSGERQDVEEHTKQCLPSSSVEAEIVDGSSKLDESKETNLKQEDDDSNSEFIEKVDVTNSTEETVPGTLKDTAESNMDSSPLDITKSSQEETQPREINGGLVEKSTMESEVSSRDTEEEVAAKEETTIDESDYVPVTAVTKETSLQEESSSPASKEKGTAGIETKEAVLEYIDINVKQEDTSNSGEKRDKEIQTVEDEARGEMDYEMQNEVSHTGSEDQKEVTTSVTPLEEKLKDDQMENSTATSEKHELMITEASETIDETPEKSQAPCENTETTSVAQATEETLMQKQEKYTNPLDVPQLGSVNTEAETANENVHHEPDNDKNLSKSEDVEISKMEETRELLDESEICASNTEKDVESSNLGLKVEEAEDKKPFDMALKSNETSGICTESEKVILETEIFEDNLKGVEVETAASEQIHDDISTKDNESLAEEAREGVQQPGDSDDIKEPVVEEERGIHEFHALSTVEETKAVEKDSAPVCSEHTKAADSEGKTETENLEVEEDSTREREASFARQSEEQKVQDVCIEAPAEESKETIKEEVIEESQDCDNKIDNATPTTVTVETSSREAELGDKPAKAFNINSDEMCPETTETENSQQGKEVDSMEVEETSRDLASKLPKNDDGHAQSESSSLKITDIGEPEETKIASEAVDESKGQGVDEINVGESLTVEKLGQVPTDDHDHAEKENAAKESSDAKKVEETKLVPRAVCEPKDQGDEETAETGESPTVEKVDQVPSSKLQENTGSVAEEFPNADEVHETKVATDAIYDPKDQGTEECAEKSPIVGKLDQVPTTKSELTEKESVTVENPNADEVHETEVISGAVHDYKNQGIEEYTDKSQTMEKMDQVPSCKGEHAENEWVEVENPNADEAKVDTDAVYYTKDQGTEEYAEKSPSIEKLDKVSATNSEHAVKESLTVENTDAVEVEETETTSNVAYKSKDQGTGDIDETGESPSLEKPDADANEEASKVTSLYSAQGAEPAAEDDTTADQTPSAKEQLLAPTSALLCNYETTTTVEKTEKVEILGDEGPDDSSVAKPTEEIWLQKEGPRELEISTLDKNTQDNTTKVHDEGDQTPDGASKLGHQENENKISCADSTTENEKITDQKRSTDEACNIKFETSEKAFKPESVISSPEVLTKSEDTDIEEKHLVAMTPEVRAEENLCTETSEANEISQTEVSEEEIREEKEVAKTYQQISLSEETRNQSLQADELKGEELPVATTSKNIEKLVSAEDRNVGDLDQVSVEDKIIKEIFPNKFQGKDVGDAATTLDPENNEEETNLGSVKAEATSPRDKEQGIEIKQKESVKGFVTESELTKDIQKLESASYETTGKQIPTEAEIMFSNGDEPVPSVPRKGVAEVETCKLGNAKDVHSELEGVKHGGEKRADESGEETCKESARGSLFDFLQTAKKETPQVTKHANREPTSSTEEIQTQEPEAIQVKEAKTDEEEGDEHKLTDSSSDAIVMVEASGEMDAKVAHKKSHGILSGVGSKVKHSISKVKKAITGKSSNQTKPVSPKPASPK